jgi:plasmid stabilization system protein ParE
MGAKVVITSQAWHDLSEIIDYIAKENPVAADQFSECLLDLALSLG